MLMISLPMGDSQTGQPEMSGHCRINGREVEYRIDERDGTFNYRHESGEWVKRYIQDGMANNNNMVTLICSETPEQYTEQNGHVFTLKG
jgi:hypothetical protein